MLHASVAGPSRSSKFDQLSSDSTHTHRAAHDQQQIRHKHRVSLWVLPVAYFFVWCVAMLGGYRAHALQPQVQAMLREAFGLDNHDRPTTSTRQERDQT